MNMSNHNNNNTITTHLSIVALQGKLGLEIENCHAKSSNDAGVRGVYVYGIDVDSPLKDQILVGDILAGIDDTPVSDMSVHQIRSLLYEKRHQEIRVFTITRATTTNIDNATVVSPPVSTTTTTTTKQEPSESPITSKEIEPPTTTKTILPPGPTSSSKKKPDSGLYALQPPTPRGSPLQPEMEEEEEEEVSIDMLSSPPSKSQSCDTQTNASNPVQSIVTTTSRAATKNRSTQKKLLLLFICLLFIVGVGLAVSFLAVMYDDGSDDDSSNANSTTLVPETDFPTEGDDYSSNANSTFPVPETDLPKDPRTKPPTVRKKHLLEPHRENLKSEHTGDYFGSSVSLP